MTENVTPDFVFGTLATDDLRLAHLRAARRGLAHGNAITPADPLPGEPVVVRITLGPKIDAERVACYYTTNGADPSGSRGIAAIGTAIEFQRETVAWDTLLWSYVEHWSGTIPGQPAGTLVRYRIEAWSDGGASAWASEIAGVVRGELPAGADPEDSELFSFPGQAPLWAVRRTGAYAYHVDRDRVPGWLREAVIYQVFVDRFATAAGYEFAAPATPGGFYGGTLRGVIERIDHIYQLGATAIWLSPIFPSPSHHGYDATEYRSVEARLGSAADLAELIAAAHAREIRVILDYVVNHVSHEHLAFQRAQADQTSAEAGWFQFTNWPAEYLSFFGVPEMPQINSDAPAAREYMIAEARYWLEQGVDGFRLDYANGPSHAFWSEFRAATRIARHDSATLGEVVETPQLQQSYQGRLDGCLDFVLMQALREFFAFGSSSVTSFDSFLRRHLAYFPGDFVLPSFLDNHDMNRFLWVVRGDRRRLKLAALCQFSLPHPPIIYYGTEVGLSQLRDVRYPDGSGHPEESRLPMLWDGVQDGDLLSFYSALVALRKSRPAAWRGPRVTLIVDDAAGLYVYRCGDGDYATRIALNNSPDSAIVILDESLQLLVATDAAVRFADGTLELPPYCGAALG